MGRMTRFSANLGFLWADHPLPEAIRLAKGAGFSAVECHWPYDTPTETVLEALADTGFEMLCLNTVRGDKGEFGLCALPGREQEARASIDQALQYAGAIGAGKIHVMAGVAEGGIARQTFIANLTYACERAAQTGASILIEPLNIYDAPGYFLSTIDQAMAVITDVAADNLKLMFDCYHVKVMGDDPGSALQTHLADIGHIQFASVPDRGPPDRGEIDYAKLFKMIDELGYAEPVGAEYKPDGDTGLTLGWMDRFR